MQRDIYVCVSVCVNAHIYTRRLNIALLIKAKNEKIQIQWGNHEKMMTCSYKYYTIKKNRNHFYIH